MSRWMVVILQETIREIKPPIVRFVFVIFLFAVCSLSVAYIRLSNRLDNKGDEHDIDYKIENRRKDSIIRSEREINRALRDTIPIIITNGNNDKIKILEQTIERFNKKKQ
jgi:Icc-related predicted phosphoesterase